LPCLFCLGRSIFFSSCDNRKDYFIDVNKAPDLTLFKNGIELTGNSLIDSLKIEFLSFNYAIKDEERLSSSYTGTTTKYF